MAERDGLAALLAFYDDPGRVSFIDSDDQLRDWSELSPEAKLAYLARDAAREGVSARRFAEAARGFLRSLTPEEQVEAALGFALGLEKEMHELARLLPPDADIHGTPLVQRFREYVGDLREALGLPAEVDEGAREDHVLGGEVGGRDDVPTRAESGRETGPGPPPISDATRNLIESIMLDLWPRETVAVDFGIDSRRHYEALYYPIREGEITPQDLDDALGHGRKLTELVKAAPSNPHKDVEFHTSWDVMCDRERPAEPHHPGPPAGSRRRARERTRQPGKFKDGPEIG
jgi:hypothetical protein